jgi:hypothetical protein
LGSKCRRPCNYRCNYWGKAEVNNAVVSKLHENIEKRSKTR